MKKILLLIDSLGSGGAQRQMVTLAEMLKKSNHTVSFLMYHRKDFFIDKLIELNIPAHYIIENRPLLRIFKIRKFIRSGGYDAVISFLETPDLLNNIAAIGGKSWNVVTSERSAKESIFQSLRGKAFAWFQRYSDALVCNSHNARLMWEKYYPKYKNKLEVIFNPVILPKITSEYIPKRNGKLHIVVAASYQYLKNPIGVIKALALMSNKDRSKIMINWYGLIEVAKGNTKAFDEAIGLIKENNLENVIHLNEPTKDIANKMNEADVVALFSKLEGLPNAICEGMMIGKPIIMSKVSDYDILVDNGNGLLCDWDNPETIKHALLTAMQWSKEELREKGNNSRRKAEKYFSNNIIIEQWNKIIQ